MKLVGSGSVCGICGCFPEVVREVVGRCVGRCGLESNFDMFDTGRRFVGGISRGVSE